MSSTNFISAKTAVELIGREDVSFVDASWYLPAHNRDGKAEYGAMRIPGAVYFDIDRIADPDTDLPHMLPAPEIFAKEASALGLGNDNLIIVYDGPGLFSSARVWWTLKIMGAEDVRILEGGFDQWKEQGLPVETGHPNPPRVRIFKAELDADRVASQQDVMANINTGKAVTIDARPGNRFAGKAAEPRAGLRSGHIPGSKSLPASDIIKGGKLADKEHLEKVFNELGIDGNTQVITSCGSGVTAAILTLALSETGRNNHKLYDGSWAEWGKENGPEVAQDEG